MQIVPYTSWAEYVMLLCDVVEHRPERVLDCACGTGNVSFELAAMGLEVTGVDIAPAMIEIARSKATASPYPVRFLEADLTSFRLGEVFDTATCLYDSLNYILDENALLSAFTHIGAHLRPEGVFIFDMNSVHALTTDLFTQGNHDPRKSLHYDWRANHDPKTGVTTVQMRFDRQEPDGSTTTFNEIHRERAYPLDQILGFLKAAGFRVEKVYDAYTLNHPHDASERWFFVARRLGQ